jgi:cation diffusion facilitator CzcD-associated flavoprotein CzcO
MNYDVIVIGSGPGGYVTAIRASQLGLKTAIVEKENLGGVCLNWGCIPTKALIKSAQVFEYINHANDYGINVNGASADFSAVIKRSRDVADGMSKGIQFLMKKNKIDVIDGAGVIKKGGMVEVTAADGKKTTYTAHANGALPRDVIKLPALAGGAGMNERVDHPTQKPLELMKDLIKKHSNVGDLVLDTFAGTGTTGHAALLLDRKYILIEKEEKYFEIIKKRLQEANKTDI